MEASILCLIGLMLLLFPVVNSAQGNESTHTSQGEILLTDITVYKKIPESWLSARRHCQMRGLYLLSIKTQQLNQVYAELYSQTLEATTIPAFWTSGIRNYSSELNNAFMWTEPYNSTMSFTNFDSKITAGTGDCVSVSKNGQWLTTTCSEELPFFCIQDEKHQYMMSTGDQVSISASQAKSECDRRLLFLQHGFGSIMSSLLQFVLDTKEHIATIIETTKRIDEHDLKPQKSPAATASGDHIDHEYHSPAQYGPGRG